MRGKILSKSIWNLCKSLESIEKCKRSKIRQTVDSALETVNREHNEEMMEVCSQLEYYKRKSYVTIPMSDAEHKEEIARLCGENTGLGG